MSDAAVLFERHDRLRGRGMPVVTVAAGPVGPGGRAWRAWAATAGREVVSAAGPDLAGVVGPWGDRFGFPDVARAAAAWLGEPDADALVHRLPRMTAHDFRAWWAARPAADEPSPTAALVRRTLAPGSPSLSVGRAADLFPEDPEPVLAFAAGLAGLVGPDRLPALEVATPPGAGADWVAGAVGTLFAIAGRVPRLPAALLAPADRVAEYLAAAGPGRPAAAVREGMVRVTGLSAADPGAEAGAARPADAAAEEAARSAAERLLFEALERDPETTGRFTLNRALDFKHGRRAAEGDLVSEDLKLAIELDGVYFHLADRDQYRRDRQKDWGYQRHGYLVLRFLSEDVFPELERVLDRVREAARWRRGAPDRRCDAAR